MIDEKKLIEELEDMIGMLPTHYIGKKDEENAYLDAINRTLSAVKRQSKVKEWIPIEERLPEEKGLYLVAYHPCYWDNVDENVVAIDVDNFGRGLWGNRKRQRVIAWMWLPEPYKWSDEE